MHDGQYPRHRVHQRERHAVRDEDHQRHAGCRRHQHVGVGHGVVLRPCAPPGFGPADEHRRRPVHLPGEHQLAEPHTERTGRPLPVGHDVGRVVAYVQAEIQRVVGRLGHATEPSRHRDISAHAPGVAPSEQWHPSPRTEHVLGHEPDHIDRPRPYRRNRPGGVTRCQDASLSSHMVVGTRDNFGRLERPLAELDGCKSAKP